MNFTIKAAEGFSEQYFQEVIEISKTIEIRKIDLLISELVSLRNGNGRLFFLGVGGSAGNASHAVNDFRKLCLIEAYAPTDNVSELTARTNDEGWETVFVEWLRTSKLGPKDAIFILSVGGGNRAKDISANLTNAIDYTKKVGAKDFGIVGRSDGYTYSNADVCIHIPTVNAALITPHSEAFQAVVWHCIVSHPLIKANPTKW
jgi:D-sedoheptulose 7-phosphate isomerase